MTNDVILALFTETLRDLLADESIVLGLDTRRSDVPDWDSFSFVTFIAAVEMKLGIRFRVAAVESFETVGDIVAETSRLLAK